MVRTGSARRAGRRQNWIGGAQHHPLDAEFVPPAPERVTGLVADLLDYATGAADSPLVHAAIVHAQFETIHPFSDGNGRVGRALIHTILTRRGLTATAVLPISLVLATRRDDYLHGLNAYRFDTNASAEEAINSWLDVFIDAADDAVTQSRRILDDIARVREDWQHRLADHREALGHRRTLRSDSTTAHILDALPAAPVLTAKTAAKLFSVTVKAASAALEELGSAGVLSTRSIGRAARAWVADDLLDLITIAERRIASTGSASSMASSTESLIASATLSGCPSVTGEQPAHGRLPLSQAEATSSAMEAGMSAVSRGPIWSAPGPSMVTA